MTIPDISSEGSNWIKWQLIGSICCGAKEMPRIIRAHDSFVCKPKGGCWYIIHYQNSCIAYLHKL